MVRELRQPEPEGDPARRPPQAHPGWVYGLRFTPDGKFLVSAGNAPKNQGYLAVWNVADGKMLYGEELPLGPFYSRGSVAGRQARWPSAAGRAAGSCRR